MQAIKPFIKSFSWILLAAFLLVLAKVILFKNSAHYYKNYFSHSYKSYKVKDGIKKGNLVPFATIKLFSKSRRLNMEYKVENLLGNIVAFIPLGFLVPLLLKRFRNIFLVLLLGFLLSVFFELIQLLTGIGVFDVDDMILNTFGSLVGYIVFISLYSIFYRRQSIQTDVKG